MSLLDKARNKQASFNDDDTIRWLPETEGEGLEGVVNAAGSFEYDGQTIPTVTLLTDDNKRYSIAGFRTVLRQELEQEKPDVGDRMAVVFLGQRKNKSGTGSHYVYRVVVEHKNVSTSNGQPAAEAPKADKPPF